MTLYDNTYMVKDGMAWAMQGAKSMPTLAIHIYARCMRPHCHTLDYMTNRSVNTYPVTLLWLLVQRTTQPSGKANAWCQAAAQKRVGKNLSGR